MNPSYPTNFQRPDGFPEETIDKLLATLNLSADTKEDLWKELNFLKNVFDYPARTKTGTTNTHIKNHAESSHEKISEALDLLKRWHHEIENPSNISTSKDYVLTEKLREQSKTSSDASSGLLGWNWPRPIDDDLLQAIASLERIKVHLYAIATETAQLVLTQGKDGKGKWDPFIMHLCRIYKNYTGKKPMAWDATASNGDTKIYGPIIIFLQLLLSHTHYGDSHSITGSALQTKLERMSKSKEYKAVFEKH